eukprot:TRINITY_DN9938_c0_g1_i15.p2 TRINITY_DN9938_c0_g1~~TRINITY_DN9938_c0_g1_i15.p2  ORF type:complete len:134 (+),score=26.08 TRINITY_DN9938_c0_g1_i15:27-404(+)
MIRRPPRSTLSSSSAASDVYKRQDIYSGNDDQILPIMALGGVGVISVIANICPKETHELTMAMLKGDLKKAREIQINFADLTECLFEDVNLSLIHISEPTRLLSISYAVFCLKKKKKKKKKKKQK